MSPTDWLLAEPGVSSEELVRSNDGGASWTTVTTMSDNPTVTGILALRFWDATNGIAVAPEGPTSGLLITADGGATWSQVDGP